MDTRVLIKGALSGIIPIQLFEIFEIWTKNGINYIVCKGNLHIKSFFYIFTRDFRGNSLNRSFFKDLFLFFY